MSTLAPRITWLAADRSGLAHAQQGRSPRALCGAPATEPRYGWPVLTRCDACQAAVVGEPTEGEQRAMAGDR